MINRDESTATVINYYNHYVILLHITTHFLLFDGLWKNQIESVWRKIDDKSPHIHIDTDVQQYRPDISVIL